VKNRPFGPSKTNLLPVLVCRDFRQHCNVKISQIISTGFAEAAIAVKSAVECVRGLEGTGEVQQHSLAPKKEIGGNSMTAAAETDRYQAGVIP